MYNSKDVIADINVKKRHERGLTMDNKKIGQFITECRKNKGITQKELAEALGVTNRAVSKWETGAGLPDISILPELAAVLGITVDEILKGEKAEPEPKKKLHISFSKKGVFAIFCFIFAMLGVAMQVVYFTLGQEYRMEYIIDELFFVANAVIIVLIFVGIFLLAGSNSKISKVCAIVLGCMLLVNFALVMNEKNEQTSIIEISPGLNKMLVLKYNEDTGRMVYYRNQILWFARPLSEFPYTVQGNVKTQWLADDICAVTYQSPDDGKVHQFVATYGDRGDGITTPYVTNLISGTWHATGNNTADWKIETGMNGVTISDGGDIYEEYGFDDCVQFGSLALALCQDGLPIWTLSLNEDCVIGDNDLLESGGSITLCRVSMDKTAPMTFTRSGVSPDYTVKTEVIKSDEERGKDLVREMKKIIRQDADLSEFEPGTECMKVVYNSENENDIYQIVRNGLEEIDKLHAVNGVDVDVQINTIEILAGGDYDCLVEVSTTEVYTENNDSSTGEMLLQYRVMKSEGAYLMQRVSYGVDGTYGLEDAVTKGAKDFSENDEYHYFVPAVRPEVN